MGATVLLGITGGIAAYKAPLLVRLMVKSGLNVHVIVSRSATEFVTPLTLATLSGNPVCQDMWKNRDKPSVEHISLADAADMAVVAPATANFIGKLANGVADDMLTTTIMAVKAPVIICPAMNENMWLNEIVQENVNKLKRFGYHFVDPEYGEMACGGEGWGRLARLDKIVAAVIEVTNQLDSKAGADGIETAKNNEVIEKRVV